MQMAEIQNENPKSMPDVHYNQPPAFLFGGSVLNFELSDLFRF